MKHKKKAHKLPAKKAKPTVEEPPMAPYRFPEPVTPPEPETIVAPVDDTPEESFWDKLKQKLFHS